MLTRRPKLALFFRKSNCGPPGQLKFASEMAGMDLLQQFRFECNLARVNDMGIEHFQHIGPI